MSPEAYQYRLFSHDWMLVFTAASSAELAAYMSQAHMCVPHTPESPGVALHLTLRYKQAFMFKY